METVLRSLAVYIFLLVVLRVSGKRTLAQVTTFDFILLLIISETTQGALVGNDNSITNCFILVVTLVGIDSLLASMKKKFPALDKLLESVPLVLVENGKPFRQRMERECIDDEDILAAARELQGVEKMEDIKYAVLERHGMISIIPRR